MLLTLSWLVPLAGALFMLLIGNADGRRDGMIRWLSLGVALAPFAVTLGLWAGFDAASADFQFVERYPWIPQFGIDYFVGIDGISLFLVVLTGFLTPIALLSSWGSIDRKVKEFSIFMLALEAAMIGVFISLDLFLFYVFWDAMLIPMYFLIGIWGYDRRVYAAIKFMLYTMAGSVLMLIAIPKHVDGRVDRDRAGRGRHRGPHLAPTSGDRRLDGEASPRPASAAAEQVLRRRGL